MSYSQQNKPTILNLDKARKYLSEKESYFLLNHERYVNLHGGNSSGSTLNKSTPLPANYSACEIEQPAGEVYTVGVYKSPLTNEVYSWHYNSNDVHYILRISESGCEIVYHAQEDKCFKLSAKPEHSIENWRAYLKVEKLCSNKGKDGVFKQLIWTNGLGEIGQIDVEASIATDSFTTEFFKRCPSKCAPIQMCVPQPCGCIQAQYIPLEASEISKTNHILDQGFKFMYRHVYYDNRASEWSDRSSLYFQSVKGCFDSAEGFPRCIKLRIPIGNPLVEKIEIAFTKGDKYTDGNNDIWYLTDTVEKYKKYNNAQENWYDRQLSEAVEKGGYSDDDCSFDYKFCNDKQCQVVDPLEVSRVFNPMPRDAQGLIPIKEALGFYNYVKGNCPVDKKEIEKFDIDINCVTVDNCTTEYSKVTVRAVIYNFGHNRVQFIHRDGEGKDDVNDIAKFGGLNRSVDGGYDDPTGYDQYFKDKTRNFIVYIEGTSYWGEMEQYHATAGFYDRELASTVDNMAKPRTRNGWRKDARQGGIFYQEYVFTVPMGTKGFIRMVSHRATDGSSESQRKTSTFVWGTLDIRHFHGNSKLVAYTEDAEEIYFDTCNKKEVELFESFVIQDNAVDAGIANSNRASAYHGYITDENNRPVEGVFVGYKSFPDPNIYPVAQTDHNGFYHFYYEKGINGGIDISIYGEQDCGEFKIIKSAQVSSEVGTNTRADIRITKDDSVDYHVNSILRVNVPVVDCAGLPIGGVRVALSGSKYEVTKADGVAKFKIRNYNTRARNIRAVVMDYSGCFNLGCDGKCNPCYETVASATPECFVGNKILPLEKITLNRNAAITNRQGLKNGGRYPFGTILESTCGRLSSVYNVRYIDIPKAQEKGRVSFCGLKYSSQDDMKLPFDGCLKIVRGENVNPFELQFLVDKVERTSDGKIKLTFQSLNEYNERYGFKTNTIYQYLKGDRVEFIKNGDGVVFNSSVQGILNYLALSPFHDVIESGQKEPPADFFNQLLIEDDGRLSNLKDGALIEVQRSKDCVTEPVYHEICATIPIKDGKLVFPNGVFSTFDTYLVNRSFGKFPTQPFEHHSPSDFWGERLTDVGKAHFVNKYENEKRFGRNITINAPNQLNYFGDLEKTFDTPDQGDIVAMDIKDGKIILAIGEHGNFIAQTADELVRVGSDGVIRALPAEAIISDGQPKLSGQFGCQYPHIGSIYFGDGYALWVDVNKHAHVKHDYNIAKDVSDGKTQTYFRRRCQEIESHNRKQTDPLNKFRFATGINEHTKVVSLTLKALRHSGIYNDIKPFSKPNDTIVIDPDSEDYLGFRSYTAEAYSHIDLFDGKGCAFISYLNGEPYIHPIISDRFNEFFGVAVDRVVGITLNKYPEKLKIGLAVEIQDQMMWFAAEVTTETDNFKSEIPPARWKKIGQQQDKWNAEFLCNVNGRGGLYGNAKIGGSDRTRGYAISITFVRDNTDNLIYRSIDNKKRVKYDELDNIFIRFMPSESSGFPESK